MAGHVFVSYRSEDKPAAERICAGLEREHIQCWIAPRDIPAGREWATAIVEAIQACCAFVMVLSSNSKNAKQISREAELADRQGIPIITFRIEDVQPPPGLMYFLGNVQWLDGFGSQFDSALAQLVRLASAAPATGKETGAASNAPSAGELRAEPAGSFAATASAAARQAPPAIEEASKNVAPSPTPWLKIGVIAVLAVAVIAAGWFLLHRPSVSPGDVNEARSVAKRFLSERDSGDFNAAWNEYSPVYRGTEKKAGWEKNIRTTFGPHGQPQADLQVCKHDGADFVCEYTLRFPDGATANQKLWLEKQGDSSWAIAHGTMTQPR